MKAMNSKSNNLHANQQQSQILEDDNDHMEFNKDNDEIQEEDKERKSFEKQKRPLSYPSSHSNRKSLATLDLKIHEPVLSFIGLSLSCRVTKHQIQIFGGHPTSIFTVRGTLLLFTPFSQQDLPAAGAARGGDLEPQAGYLVRDPAGERPEHEAGPPPALPAAADVASRVLADLDEHFQGERAQTQGARGLPQLAAPDGGRSLLPRTQGALPV